MDAGGPLFTRVNFHQFRKTRVTANVTDTLTMAAHSSVPSIARLNHRQPSQARADPFGLGRKASKLEILSFLPSLSRPL